MRISDWSSDVCSSDLGHLRAPEDTRGRSAGADGTGRAVHAVGAVGGGHAAEPVALHRTREALALAHCGDVDLVAVGQEVGLELLANRVVGHVVQAELDELRSRVDARLLELAELGLGDLGGLLRSEGDLEGGVAVVLVCLDLHDAAGLDPEDGRSEEHTSELQSLMRISYAVFCLKQKKKNQTK